MTVRIISILILASLASGDVLLFDDFSDGNADGWLETGTATFQVVEEEYLIFGPAGSYGLSTTGDSTGVMTVPDYSFRCSVLTDICTDVGLLARYNGAGEYHYYLYLKPEMNGIFLFVTNGMGSTVILDQEDFELELGQIYWLRLEVEGSDVRGKIWTGSAGDEPVSPQLQGVSTHQQNPGSIGIYCKTIGLDAGLSVYFDNVEVRDDFFSSLGSSTWAGIKSSDY